MPRIPEPNENDTLSSAWGRDVASALNARRIAVHSDRAAADRLLVSRSGQTINLALHPRIRRPLFGIVKTAGPAAEQDYTDERYWIKEVSISAATPQTALSIMEMTYGAAKRCRYVTASNLAEVVAGTHSLLAGAYVGPLTQLRDTDGVSHWVFDRAPSLPLAVKIADVDPDLLGDILTGVAAGAGVYDDNEDDHWPVVDLGNGCPKVDDVYPCIGFDGTNYFIATASARLKGTT